MCVCVCVRACVRVCVRACVPVCVRACLWIVHYISPIGNIIIIISIYANLKRANQSLPAVWLQRDTENLEMLCVNIVFVSGCPHNAFSDHLDSNMLVMHLRLAARSWETGCAKLSYRKVRLCYESSTSFFILFKSKTWVPQMNTEYRICIVYE